LIAIGALATTLSGCGLPAAGGPPIEVGAVYPLSGNQADGGNELAGVKLAAELINQDGGVKGRPVSIVSQDAPSADTAPAAVDKLSDRGISVMLGTYGSTQALTASARASERGATYLETGAVADAITGRGLPGILRTVATGSTLGRNAARFAHDFVIPGLKMDVARARVVIMFEGDQYGASVGYGAIDEANIQGLNVVDTIKYDIPKTDFNQLAATVDADRPDVILTASYLEDAVAFRRAALARHLNVKSIIGTSSAYCRVDFGNILGPDAVGLFASDKPDESLRPEGLTPEARKLLHRASAAYRARYSRDMEAEVVAGFVGGWLLFHDILPKSASTSRVDVWKTAMSIDLPAGSLINGAGVKFAPEGSADAGQNRRAAGVIWEWVGVRKRAVVSPPAYAVQSPVTLPITN
jgi:branched-chain amino acid transport system substrate-binding protein